MEPTAAESGVRRDHFAKLVRDWSHFGPPLRPSSSDTAVIRRVAAGQAPAPHIVVLGLTPETIGGTWPDRTELLALDHSAAMLRSMWPQPGAPTQSGAVMANWLQMPLRDGSIDVVCGDGCHTQVPYPRGFAGLSTEVLRVLQPAGLFITRVFMRPDQPEPLEQIAGALAAGHIQSVHALKLRLLAALHGHSGDGSCMGDAWQAWKRMPALPPGMEQERGWTPDEVVGIEGYAGLGTRYYLPTLDELRAVHGKDFIEIECSYGDYALAERCPTLVLQRRA